MENCRPMMLSTLFRNSRMTSLIVYAQFRRNPIALACDIPQMYLQITIDKKDRFYPRILWRNLDVEGEPQECEFDNAVFDKNSAPIKAQFTARENGRSHQNQYPLAAETILESTYMDDSIENVENETDSFNLSCITN